jgi:hypothetical protein
MRKFQRTWKQDISESAALEKRLQQKAKEFKETGAEIYARN